MVKRLFTAVAVAATVAVLLGGTVSADILPIAPPGNSVSLNPGDFIQYVPEETPGLPVPNPVAGENIGQHPGVAFPIGFPPLRSFFFIGVFGGPIDTSDPNSAVYLWETSAGPNTPPFSGPEIQLGFWDGMTFSPYGSAQSASYLGTGVMGTDPSREVTSSVTPLAAFGITPGFPFPLNAVRIEAADLGHNQVTAVAANTVPEPSSLLLLGTVVVGMIGTYRLRHRKR